MQGNNNKSHALESSANNQNPVQPIPFSVQALPQERFHLFEQPDYFICEKKFYNTLPKPTIAPKVFNYNISNERFLKLDMSTLMFGLRQNQAILTDSKLNTNIHMDFIDKSINLILPQLESANGATLLGHKRKVDDKFRGEVLSIIEAEDVKKDSTINKTKDSFYLRKSTFVTPSLNVNKKYNQADVKQEKEAKILKTTKVSEEKLAKEKVINIRNGIEESFEKIKSIEEESQHPYKKGVHAKKVYSLKPFLEVFNTKISEIQFDTDPATEVDSYNTNPIKSFLVKFKKNNINNNSSQIVNMEDDKVVSLYRNKNNNFDNDEMDKNFYEYERDYRYHMCSSYEIFNTTLIFLNRQNLDAMYLPMDKKFILKKFKKKEAVINKFDENGDEEPKKPIKEKDIILTSIPLSMGEVSSRNEFFNQNGIKLNFINKEKEKRGIKIRIERNVEQEKKLDVVVDVPVTKTNKQASQEEEESYDELFNDDDEEDK